MEKVRAQATSAAPDMADSGERAPTETGAGAASPLLLSSPVHGTAGTGAQVWQVSSCIYACNTHYLCTKFLTHEVKGNKKL